MTLDVGFIDDVFAVMKGEAEHMSNMEKICIISLDGMYLSNRVEFEPYQQQILGPYNCVQNILNTEIEKLYSVGFTTVAFVSDMGSKNCSLHKKINLTPENPFLKHLIFLVGNKLHFSDGTMISRASLDALLEVQTSQLKPGWKLSKSLLDVKGSERQNVKATAKVLS
ncbi:hypothetical protein QTP88_014013 [Uroleucon formosanum]